MARELPERRRVAGLPAERSVADGIAVKRPGERTFEHIRHYVDGIVTVTEEEIRTAIIRLLETGKTVTEGAAADHPRRPRRARSPRLAGRQVVMLLSGANIDIALLGADHRPLPGREPPPGPLPHPRPRPSRGARELLKVLGRNGGNVVRIQHDRVFMHGGFWEAQVDVTLETRNQEHIEELEAVMGERGYKVEQLD